MREIPLVMPKMSMTMTEGTFLVWRREPGEAVKAGDVVCEVASDKVDMEVESPVEGTLSRLLAQPDQVLGVGEPLAYITSDADDLLDGLFDSGSAPEPEPALVTAHAAAQAVPAATPPSRRGPRPAVPFARRRASELRVDINTIVGSGPDGLITVGDVEKAAPKTTSDAVTPTPAPAVPTATADNGDQDAFGETTTQSLSRINKVSAAALTRSWTTIPHVTQHDTADITELDAYRRELDAAAKLEGTRVTLLAFLLKAVVSALKAHPRVNSSLAATQDALVLKHYYHLGVAVDTAHGLVVPVIRDVDRKGITELSRDLADVSARARDGKLSGDDVRGATFTVSSLGGIGGTAFTPIVNSPEAAILGVSKSRTEPVWDGEQFVPRLMLPLSLSYDHRIIDGALAARFTSHLGHLLGDVRRLLL
ncbi:branched-chain alpha-keto acid dehydrogenase subunit E2 [Mycolicibacterium cosmeticum]|uniref:Dihydrolipoamide acetyltransferase component of pyruvate dehydrogenase complex n=1 Tax=Mycolicibacterium cosmeticum TaxID=258533 RepID=W9ARZ8_MYCCO|nr:2-oxo acid dehydrogenase subunit E2 [Mycolicibacterium cosmeticum]TLH72635.1 branched-chain alpha-keto acid dehydrogenase subunit E2 [Mycolicibacterium cosmeticum]CDO05657.1 dihydrolipoamide acetyltransferase [Mycolicibacterium cosmeticum]